MPTYARAIVHIQSMPAAVSSLFPSVRPLLRASLAPLCSPTATIAWTPFSLIYSLLILSPLYKKALNLASDSRFALPATFTTVDSTMQESIPSSMPSPLARRRPKTTYYHNGIGGRGNYHKRAEDTDPTSHQQRRSNFPRSIAAFFSGSENLQNASKTPTFKEEEELSHPKVRELHFPSRWFISIGSLGNRRARRQHSPSSDMSATTVTSEHSTQALPLGAADVMRRKILGERSAPKPGD